jgi:glutamate dehydrogenase/leucine dehydrogenase
MGSDLLSLSIPRFLDHLREAGVRRLYVVWDDEAGRYRASHEAVEPLAAALAADDRDADRHEGVFLSVGKETGALHGAFVHRSCRGQGAGGVRFWRYPDVESYLRDGLRLSRGMTHKNALAGLWWGGGKGVVTSGEGGNQVSSTERRRIYEEFGDLMTSLRGCYVTAEDVGTSVDDMAAIFSRTRFTTCIPPELGGSGNPSGPTARGVVRGMEAALAFLEKGDLRGKTVAIQGLGHVGEPMVELLVDRGVERIEGADLDAGCLERIESRFGGRVQLALHRVEIGDHEILAADADVVSPCAVGAVLDERTIPRIKAPIVCGAANNQLADPDAHDRLLAERGIAYVPDFLVNRMGIVNCADEAAGYVDDDPVFEAHLGETWENGIYRLTLDVLERARRTGASPGAVALELAERRSFEEHPIFGHRGRLIIRSLVSSGWAD